MFFVADDDETIDQGEYQGQVVEIIPEGAEWHEALNASGRPAGNGQGQYRWEYECPVCRVFYYASAEKQTHICAFCEITHVCLGAISCTTPRRIA